MKTYIFRDVWTGKIYRVYAFDAMEAKLMNIPSANLHRVKRQHAHC